MEKNYAPAGHKGVRTVAMVARKAAGEKAFTASIEAEELDEVFCGLQAMIEEICSVTGMTIERVIVLLAARMLAQE